MYARDVMGPPLHALAALLNKIRIGASWPDATRSGRWLATGQDEEPSVEVSAIMVAPPSVAEPLVPRQEEDANSSGQDGSNSSDSEDSGAEQDTEAASRSIFQGTDPYPPMPDGGVWFGSRRGTIHRWLGQEVPKAACGYGLKLIASQWSNEWPTGEHPLCRNTRCFPCKARTV